MTEASSGPWTYWIVYHGYVHADAYGGYDELFRKDDITEVGCWAHAIRKFDESTSSRPKEAIEGTLVLVERESAFICVHPRLISSEARTNSPS